MRQTSLGPVSTHVELEQLPLAAPFRIAGYTFHELDVVVVSVEMDGHVGRGEAAGVYYKSDKAASMVAQIAQIRSAIEAGVDRKSLQSLLLPPGGARNADSKS